MALRKGKTLDDHYGPTPKNARFKKRDTVWLVINYFRTTVHYGKVLRVRGHPENGVMYTLSFDYQTAISECSVVHEEKDLFSNKDAAMDELCMLLLKPYNSEERAHLRKYLTDLHENEIVEGDLKEISMMSDGSMELGGTFKRRNGKTVKKG